jgi:hypothetical protein
MESIPFALSIHSFVNSVGADAGFASIIGLAILVLLYFAQARETATLRDRLDEESARAHGLEQRMAMLQRPPPAPAQPPADPAGMAPGTVRLRAGAAQAAPATSRIPAGEPGGGGGRPTPAVGLPFAPAGMGAPALAAATKLIPGGGAAATPAGTAGPGLAERPSSGPDDTMLVAPRPVTAAANGHSQTAPPVRPPDFSPPPAPAPPVQIRPPASAGGPRRPVAPSRPSGSRDRALARRVIPALIGLGVIAVIVIALIVITSGASPSKTVVHPSRTAQGRSHGKGKAAPAVVPANVTVSVLNGTDVTNLAHDVSVKLSGLGYRQGQIATAASQTHATTIVGYMTGQRADAVAVAKALGVSTSNVQPADAQAKGVACPSLSSTTACSSDVIVTIGTDLASTAGTSTT